MHHLCEAVRYGGSKVASETPGREASVDLVCRRNLQMGQRERRTAPALMDRLPDTHTEVGHQNTEPSLFCCLSSAVAWPVLRVGLARDLRDLNSLSVGDSPLLRPLPLQDILYSPEVLTLRRYRHPELFSGTDFTTPVVTILTTDGIPSIP